MSCSVQQTELLIIGGGAAGLSAAAEAATYGIRTLVVESDLHLGGQLVKQTHKFFGSKDEYAGTRGFDIAQILLSEIQTHSECVQTLTNTSAIGYYKDDGMVTAMKGEEHYFKIKAKRILIASGAQERLIPFPNNDLPGVYGAGAVQTLMNVYGVKPGRRVLMLGAGNIGLIVSYQLMQAGVEVAGILEAAPRVGGYWVHAAKLRRYGVPIYLRHTVKAVLGESCVEGAVVQNLEDGSLSRIACDTLCLAVGLNPTAEIAFQAGCRMQFIPQLCGYVPLRDSGMRTSRCDMWVAGDAAGIEEASAAMIEGRIAASGIAASLGHSVKSSRVKEFETRLFNLRNGESSERIKAGISLATVERWGDRS